MITKIEKEKLDFIDAAQDAIDAAVEPIIRERMNAYREQFGSLNRVDCRLWGSCSISYVVAFQSAIEMDVDEED